MITVKVTCEGTYPLLMERMSEETLTALYKGTRQPQLKLEPEEEARSKLYVNPETGEPAIPADNFRACLVEAGTFVSFKGMKKISTATESILPGVLNIQEEWLPLESNSGWKVDKRRGRLESTGAAVCIVRPRFDHWRFSATLEIDDSQIEVGKIRELVEVAGRFKGLGGFRKKGWYGRFRIEKWEVLEERRDK